MKSTLKFRAALSLAALAVVQVAIPKTASAAVATDTWNGSTNATWTAAGSWTSGNDPPQAGDSLLFTGTTAGANSVDNDSGLSINNLTFDSGAKSFTLSSSNGTNPSTLTVTSGVIDNATKAQTIGTGTTGLILTGSGGVTLNAGSLTLDGANTYTGTTTVAAGTLFGSAANAFGSGGLTVNGGKAELEGFNETVAFLDGSGGSITDAGTLTFGGSGTYTYSGTISDGANPPLALVDNNTGTQIFNGKISYTGTTAINDGTLQVSGTNTETLSGGISGGGYLTVGDGSNTTKLTLLGTLNYTGATTITNASTLTLGSTAVFTNPLTDVESGATFSVSAVSGGFILGASVAQTLEGSGNVTGNVTLDANGTLSPGFASADAIGTLTITGNVTLGGTFSAQVDPDNDETPPNDQLAGSAKVVLGGTLNVTASNSDPLTSGDSYTLISATNGIQNGSGVQTSFSSVTLPSLNAGLSWDTTMMDDNSSNYQSKYAISVVNTVPAGFTLGAPFYSASLNAGQSYKGYYIQNPGARQTDVQFLDGTVSNATSLSVQFSAAPEYATHLISDYATVSGTNSDTYVLELNYTSALLGAFEPTSPVLAVDNSGILESAVLLNSGGTAHEILGAYTSADFTLGNYGVDLTNHEVWAVLNYSGSDKFGVSSRLQGDAVGTGMVTPQDISIVLADQGDTTNLWSLGDFNDTNTVSGLDISQTLAAMGQSVAGSVYQNAGA